jgi:hypothetical protein
LVKFVERVPTAKPSKNIKITIYNRTTIVLVVLYGCET